MPVRRKPNGKWTFSDSGHPEYDSKASAMRSYYAYLATKHGKGKKR